LLGFRSIELRLALNFSVGPLERLDWDRIVMTN